MGQRIKKINELIKRELSEIINRTLEIPPGVLATITQVETTSDLTQSKVWISVYPFDRAAEVLKFLIRQAANLQRLLQKRIRMRQVLKIRFILDKSQERASKVEESLAER